MSQSRLWYIFFHKKFYKSYKKTIKTASKPLLSFIIIHWSIFCRVLRELNEIKTGKPGQLGGMESSSRLHGSLAQMRKFTCSRDSDADADGDGSPSSTPPASLRTKHDVQHLIKCKPSKCPGRRWRDGMESRWHPYPLSVGGDPGEDRCSRSLSEWGGGAGGTTNMADWNQVTFQATCETGHAGHVQLFAEFW